MKVVQLPLSQISCDPRAQPREHLDQEVIEEYAEAMREGSSFPPVMVFYDGDNHHLADGFHRVEAASRAGRDSIPAEVREGTMRAAILWSVSANADHGLRRSNADKRRAVRTLVQDEEWRTISDAEIAARCSVSRPLVADVRAELEAKTHPAELQDKTRMVTRGGTRYPMDLTKIRRKRGEKNKPADLSPPDISPNRESLHASAIEVLLELSRSLSTFPLACTMARLLNQHEADFTSMQAREIARWFQILADRLDQYEEQASSATTMALADEPVDSGIAT
jgi:hypothetical protein